MERFYRAPDGGWNKERRSANGAWMKWAAGLLVPIFGVISTWAVLNYRVDAQEARLAETQMTVAKHETEIAVLKTDIGYIKEHVSKISHSHEDQKALIQEVLRELRRP